MSTAKSNHVFANHMIMKEDLTSQTSEICLPLALVRAKNY